MAAADYYTQVYTMFVGYFGRPPAKSGLDNYADLVDKAGGNLAVVIDDFYKSDESKAFFAGKSVEQQINQIFQNLFGRDALPAGLNYWAAQINSGAVALSQAAYTIAFNAAAADVAVRDAKIASAKLWVAGLDTTAEILAFGTDAGRTSGRDFLKAVTTSTAATQAATDAALKAMVDGGTTNVGQTYTLTSGIDNIVGTAGDDTFIGDDSGASPSISPADTINGGSGGSDSSKLFISAAGRSLNATSVEKFFITSTNDASTFSMNGVSGAEQIWATNLTGDLSVTNTKNAVTVGVQGGATNALGAGTENYEVEFIAGIASGTATATVAMAAGNVANFGVGSGDGTQDFGTVKFVTSGSAASSIGDLKDGAGNDSNTTTVVIEGSQRMTINAEIENVTTVTATAADGGARVILDEALNVTFAGGKGADRVDITTGLTNADNLNGADGTDTLRIADGATVTLANVANVKNFEVLEIRAGSAGGAGAGTYDVSVLEAQNKLTSIVISRVANAAHDVVVNNIQDGAKGSLVLALDEIDDVTYEVDSFVSGGTSDSATIVLNNAVALAADGVDVTGPLTFTNVDILTVNSTRNTLAASTENSIAGLTATDLDKLVIVGNEATNIAADGASISLTEIDATGLTRDVTDAAATVNVGAAAIAAILIKGSAGVDTITANNAATNAVTVFTGGGSDVLQLGVTGATHTLKFNATALNSGDVSAGGVIAINAGNAFQAADTVTLDFSSALEGLLKVAGANLGTTLANVALVGQAFGPNTNVIAIDNGNDTVFQIDLNGDGIYTQASDFQITLTGLANNTLTYNAATDVFVFTATA